MVAACIINLVETIRSLRPNSTIVINSLWPIGFPDLDTPLEDSVAWTNASLPVNERLECYASGAARVEFANVTDLFVVTKNGETVIDLALHWPDGFHLSAKGSHVYGEAIVEKTAELINMK